MGGVPDAACHESKPSVIDGLSGAGASMQMLLIGAAEGPTPRFALALGQRANASQLCISCSVGWCLQTLLSSTCRGSRGPPDFCACFALESALHKLLGRLLRLPDWRIPGVSSALCGRAKKRIQSRIQMRIQLRIELRIHLYQTLFESQGIGTKYICAHI